MIVRIVFVTWLLAWTLLGQAADHGSGIVVSLDGQEHKLDSIDWVSSKITMDGDDIRYYFTQEDHPFSVNFNLANTGVMQQGSGEFTVPEDNHGNMSIDLNFFDKDRPGSRMGKRLRFTQGTITIEEITPDVLRMSFEGTGHPLTKSKETFPVKGSIDIRF